MNEAQRVFERFSQTKETVNFAIAMHALHHGYRVKRDSWLDTKWIKLSGDGMVPRVVTDQGNDIRNHLHLGGGRWTILPKIAEDTDADAADAIRYSSINLDPDPEPMPKLKQVYQWRYKNTEQVHWKVAKSLLTKEEAVDYFDCEIAPVAGPFEVPV